MKVKVNRKWTWAFWRVNSDSHFTSRRCDRHLYVLYMKDLGTCLCVSRDSVSMTVTHPPAHVG
jgi:hypothetical protein